MPYLPPFIERLPLFFRPPFCFGYHGYMAFGDISFLFRHCLRPWRILFIMYFPSHGVYETLRRFPCPSLFKRQTTLSTDGTTTSSTYATSLCSGSGIHVSARSTASARNTTSKSCTRRRIYSTDLNGRSKIGRIQRILTRCDIQYQPA